MKIIPKFDNKYWEQVVDKGFGDKNNVYIWSMKKFNGFLYIGTINDVKGCQIYRSESGNKGTWKQVNESGFGHGLDSAGARNMIVYKNLLWVVTSSWRIGTQVWITNGEENKNGLLNWEKANKNGFGDGKNVPSSRSICVYKNKLYVGSRGIDSPRIYRYEGPTDLEGIDPNKWNWINEDWQENPDHNPYLFLPGEMIKYKAKDGKEYLYVGVYIDAVPLIDPLLTKFTIKNLKNLVKMIFLRCEIWRYDGNSWGEVIKKGFGRSNTMALAAQELNNILYFGTHNMLGAEIWKTEDGTNWSQIAKRGFGKIFNFGVWGIYKYRNRLIVGTENPISGCQIWASITENPKKQKDFVKINTSGMKKKIFNHFRLKQDGIQEFEVFKGKIYTGTACWMSCATRITGPGCEIWRIDHLPKELR